MLSINAIHKMSAFPVRAREQSSSYKQRKWNAVVFLAIMLFTSSHHKAIFVCRNPSLCPRMWISAQYRISQVTLASIIRHLSTVKDLSLGYPDVMKC